MDSLRAQDSQKPLWNIFFTLQSNSHLMCCHNTAVAVLFQHKVSSLFAVFEQSVHPSFSFSPNVSLFSYEVKLSNLKVSKCVDSSNTSDIYLSKITFLPIRLPRKGVWAEPDLVVAACWHLSCCYLCWLWCSCFLSTGR